MLILYESLRIPLKAKAFCEQRFSTCWSPLVNSRSRIYSRFVWCWNIKILYGGRMTYQYFNIIFVHAFKCRGSAKRQHLFCCNKQTLHRHQLIIMLSQNFHQPHLHLLLSVSNEDLLRCSMQKLCSCLARLCAAVVWDGWVVHVWMFNYWWLIIFIWNGSYITSYITWLNLTWALFLLYCRMSRASLLICRPLPNAVIAHCPSFSGAARHFHDY